MYERILMIIRYYNLSISQFSREIGLNSPATIQKIITYKRKASPKTSGKILNRFPDINYDWLITGRGDMLKNESNKENDVEFNGYNNEQLDFIEKVSYQIFIIERELKKTSKKCENINIKDEILEQTNNLSQLNGLLTIGASKRYFNKVRNALI